MGSPGLAIDKPILNRLTSLGYRAVSVDDNSVTTSSVSGASVLVVSSSVQPNAVPKWLKTSGVPILVLETYLIDDLELGSSVAERPASMTVSTQEGRRVNLSKSLVLGRALAPPSATVVAGVPNGNKETVYLMESGAVLTDGSRATARRAVFAITATGPRDLNSNGWVMFDKSLKWAAAR